MSALNVRVLSRVTPKYFRLSSCGMFWPSQVTCSWYFANLCAKWKLVHTVFPVFIFSLQLLK